LWIRFPLGPDEGSLLNAQELERVRERLPPSTRASLDAGGSDPEVSAVSAEKRFVEQGGGPWSTLDFVTLPVFFLVGGWVLLIFLALTVAPLWLLGLAVYAPFLRHYHGSPHTRLNVTCDLCDQPAVGYKEIRSTSGFLHRFNSYLARGFLCQPHTAEYVGRANRQNLAGMFLFLGGWGVLPRYFWSRAQSVMNLPILGRGVGRPGVDPHFDLAVKLCEKAKSFKDWHLVSEFSMRALRDETNQRRVAQMLIYRGVGTAAQEQLLDRGGRKPDDAHLQYLEAATRDLEGGIRLAREHGLSDRLIQSADAVLKDVRSRREAMS